MGKLVLRQSDHQAIAWSFAYAYPDLVDKLIVMNLPHPAKFMEGIKTPQQLLSIG
jgi:hypothetical protein